MKLSNRLPVLVVGTGFFETSLLMSHFPKGCLIIQANDLMLEKEKEEFRNRRLQGSELLKQPFSREEIKFFIESHLKDAEPAELLLDSPSNYITGKPLPRLKKRK